MQIASRNARSSDAWRTASAIRIRTMCIKEVYDTISTLYRKKLEEERNSNSAFGTSEWIFGRAVRFLHDTRNFCTVLVRRMGSSCHAAWLLMFGSSNLDSTVGSPLPYGLERLLCKHVGIVSWFSLGIYPPSFSLKCAAITKCVVDGVCELSWCWK